MYSIIYTLTVQFWIKDDIRQVHNNNFIKYEKQTMGQVTTVLLLLNFNQKNMLNLDQKVNQQWNTVCLEQQIYASPENFTPTLLVMLETFSRSGKTMGCSTTSVVINSFIH